MRARGIDPGTGVTAWCDIDREAPGVYRYVDSGTLDAAELTRDGPARFFDPLVAVYVIETPAELHHSDIMAQLTAVSSRSLAPGVAGANISATVRHLLETRALAERIACSLVGAGARVVEPTAAQCRAALGVKLGAQRGRGPKLTVDQQIGQFVPLYVRGWPLRSNVHVRDAAAAALWALGGAEVEAAVALAMRRG